MYVVVTILSSGRIHFNFFYGLQTRDGIMHRCECQKFGTPAILDNAHVELKHIEIQCLENIFFLETQEKNRDSAQVGSKSFSQKTLNLQRKACKIRLAKTFA